MTRFEDPLRVKYGQLDVTDHPYIFASDADFGAGENLYEALAGLLADGESVTSSRTSNREFSFGVWVEGPTLDQIEDPEMALIAEAERPRNELTVWPGDNGTPFVLETFRAQVNHERTDAREAAGMRLIVLTVKALPFVRAVEPTLSEVMSAPPAPVGPVIITVDNCNSVAGWSASPSPIASDGDHVYNSTWAQPGTTQGVWLTRTAAVDMSGTPYLVVEWCRESKDWSSIWNPPVLNATTQVGPLWDSQIWRAPIQTSILDAKWARSVWELPNGVVPKLAFGIGGGRVEHRLNIRDIKRSDQFPAPRATGHQLSRTIEVGGSARTQASLHMWATSGSLGGALVHTSSTPNGMFSCEPFLTTSSAAAGGTVTSTEKSMATGVKYEVPASLFDPDRATGYMLLARMRKTALGPVTVTVTPARVTELSGGETQTATVPAMASHGFVSLGLFNMPPRRVDGEAATMNVTATCPDGTLDDLWFVDVETGSLTWVNNVQTGGMWIESPTLTSPLLRVRGEDPLGGYELEPQEIGRHDFPPGPLHIYTVATVAESSRIQLEYFERGLFHLRR